MSAPGRTTRRDFFVRVFAGAACAPALLSGGGELTGAQGAGPGPAVDGVAFRDPGGGWRFQIWDEFGALVWDEWRDVDDSEAAAWCEVLSRRFHLPVGGRQG